MPEGERHRVGEHGEPGCVAGRWVGRLLGEGEAPVGGEDRLTVPTGKAAVGADNLGDRPGGGHVGNLGCQLGFQAAAQLDRAVGVVAAARGVDVGTGVGALPRVQRAEEGELRDRLPGLA